MNSMSPRHRLGDAPPPPVEDDGVPNLRRLRLLAGRHLGALLISGAAGLGLALVYQALSNPVHEAHAMVLMSRPSPLAAGLAEGPGAIPDAELRNELEVIRSKELAAEVVARLGSAAPPGPPEDTRAMEERLRQSIRVSRIEGSHIFIIDARASDPEGAARLANAVAGAYVDRREAEIAAAAADRRVALEARVAELRAAVAARQAEIVAASRDSSRFEEAMVRRGELEQLLESDRAAHARALAELRDTDRSGDPAELRASLLSDAVPPIEPTGPKPFMILTLGLCLGLACGGAIALARENLDDTLRTGDELRRALGQPFLGYLPRLPGAGTREGLADHPVWRVAADHPRCRYAETLRFIRARAERRGGSGSAPVLGIASARAGEGKSLAAANLAALLAAEGLRVLLIDADLRGTGLGTTFGNGATVTLADLAASAGPAGPHLAGGEGGFTFLPARGAAAAPLYIDGERLARVLDGQRGHFDFIILDLPALEDAAHARGALPVLDGWIAVARWGVTPGQALRSILRDDPELARNLLGAVLSDVRPEELRRYTHHAGAGA